MSTALELSNSFSVLSEEPIDLEQVNVDSHSEPHFELNVMQIVYVQTLVLALVYLTHLCLLLR